MNKKTIWLSSGAAIFAVCALAFAVGFVAGQKRGMVKSADAYGRSIAALTEQQGRTQAALKELLDLARTPEMPPLKTAKWQGRNIEIIDYALDPTADLQLLAGTGLPSEWQPSPEGDPETSMPYQRPQIWLKVSQQRFAPETVFYNLVGFANRIRLKEGQANDFEPYLELILTRTREFLTRADNGGGMVTYRFPVEWIDHTFQPGWVSSFGNASLITASVYYYKQTSDPRFLALAKELVDGLKTLDGRDAKWLSHVDDAQFLWFEEYPINGPEKAHVLNGHIWTTFALADYCRLTNDAEACLMTKAGLTTIRRYIKSYRVPGQANRYSLYSDIALDYGPTRTINQQHALFSLTGDRFFADMANAFASDMPYNPR